MVLTFQAAILMMFFSSILLLLPCRCLQQSFPEIRLRDLPGFVLLHEDLSRNYPFRIFNEVSRPSFFSHFYAVLSLLQFCYSSAFRACFPSKDQRGSLLCLLVARSCWPSELLELDCLFPQSVGRHILVSRSRVHQQVGEFHVNLDRPYVRNHISYTLNAL